MSAGYELQEDEQEDPPSRQDLIKVVLADRSLVGSMLGEKESQEEELAENKIVGARNGYL